MKLSNVFKSIKRNKLLKTQKGFSLVELMVVVAIIGILASIAIPSYQKFQRRARQTEAKTTLSGIYTAQTAFIAEYALGTPNLLQMGFTPGGQVSYLAGFDNSVGTNGTIGTLNINLKARPTGYNGPASKEVQDVTTFHVCDTSAIGGYAGSDLPSCQVPLGADKNPNGKAMAINDIKGGCTRTAGNGSCTFDAIAQSCTASTTSPVTTCSQTGPALNNIGRNSVSFTLGATANIGGSNADQWIMDEAKNLINLKNGS